MALKAANDVTAITHDHPEGMKGAQATTHAIWLAIVDDLHELIDEARRHLGQW